MRLRSDSGVNGGRIPACGGARVREAICPHILAAATHSGTCTLNRRLP